MSTLNPPDRRTSGKGAAFFAAAVAMLATAFREGSRVDPRYGRPRTEEMRAKAADERAARAVYAIPRAEEKRARRRQRNLATQ